MTLFRGTRWRFLIAFGVAYALLTSATDVNARVKGPNSTKYQAYLNASKVPNVLHIKVVTRRPVGCEGARTVGCTWAGGPVWLSRWLTPRQRRTAFLHEAGHQYDFRRLNDAERERIKALFGMHRSWWQPESAPAWYTSPGELYADLYSWCAQDRWNPTPSIGYALDEYLHHSHFQYACAEIRDGVNQ